MIVVRDVTYRWYMRGKPTYAQSVGASMFVGIQRQNEPGALIVDCVVARPDASVGGHGGAVTPEVVRDMIERAVDAGWALGTTPPHRMEYPLSADVIGLPRRR